MGRLIDVDAYSETVDPTPKWIPVENRLPKLNEEVLAHYECGKIRIASRFYTTMQFDLEAHYGKVTHWMPLPEPPEMETE